MVEECYYQNVLYVVVESQDFLQKKKQNDY